MLLAGSDRPPGLGARHVTLVFLYSPEDHLDGVSPVDHPIGLRDRITELDLHRVDRQSGDQIPIAAALDERPLVGLPGAPTMAVLPIDELPVLARAGVRHPLPEDPVHPSLHP